MKLLFVICAVLATTLEINCSKTEYREFNVQAEQEETHYSRIIGGTAVSNRSECLYQASLQYMNTHHCGAIVIDSQNVLTSAFCVYGLKPADLSIKTGHLNRTDTTATSLNISRIKIHQSYNSSTYNNDIAILHLSSNLTFGAKIGAVGISMSRPNVSASCTIFGWGNTNQTVWSATLNKATVRIINDTVCAGVYGAQKTDNMICAQGTGTDACNYDFGGPLMFGNNLVGIVSLSKNNTCGVGNVPRLYTDVTKYTSWIQANKQKSAANILFLNIGLLAIVAIVQLFK